MESFTYEQVNEEPELNLDVKLVDIEDAELIYNAIKSSEKSLNKFLGYFVDQLSSLEDTKKFLKRAIQKSKNELGYQLLLKDSENFVGLVGLNKRDEGVYELLGWISEDYQGINNTSLKVLQESLKFAFNKENINKTISFVKIDNLSSLRVNIRAGLNFNGFRKRFSQSQQEEIYEVKFELTRQDWEKIEKNGVDIESSTKMIRKIRELYREKNNNDK